MAQTEEQEINDILNKIQYTDLTQELKDLTKSMGLGDMINSETFTLYDSMSGTELGDPKMDVKQTLEKADTVQKMINDKRIKPASELSNQEVCGVFDQLITQQFSWLEGNSLAHSLYQIGYMYDTALYKDNQQFKVIMETLFFTGNNFFELTRFSSFLREDDYVVSIFSFPLVDKEPEQQEKEIEELLESFKGKVTNAVKKKTKKNIKLNEFDCLYARIQLQKFIFQISCIITKMEYSIEIKEKLEKLIKQARQYLEEIKKTPEFSQDMSQIKSDSIFKTLVIQLSPRQIKERTVEQGYQNIENMFQLIEHIIKMSKETGFYAIQRLVQQIHSMPKNIAVKSYLDTIFLNGNDQSYFNHINFLEVIQTELQNFGLTQEQINSEFMQNHIRRLFIVQHEYLAKHLKNKYRQQREFPKLHQDLSIIIHESSQADAQYFQKTKQQQALVIQTYDMGIKLMIKQLWLGQELNLYEEADYPQVLFYLDYLHTILEKNQTNFVAKLDKDFIKAYNQKTSLEKLKKKLTDFQRTYFYDFVYCKALNQYLKAMSRLTYYLLKNKCLPNYNQQNEYKNRFNNRFDTLFSQVYYVKKLDYDQYENYQEDFWNQFETMKDGLSKVSDLFKDSQTLLALIPQNDNTVPEIYKTDGELLKKICVMNSLNCLDIASNPKTIENATYELSNEIHNLYPVVQKKKEKK